MTDAEAKKPRVLVVDDDVSVRSLVKDALETAQFEVETAADGEECLRVVADARPDLILMDVDMPILNGWETLERLKADPLLRHVPILMLTSMSQISDKVKGLDLGANDYVTKPFPVAELVARCRSALRNTTAGLEANPLSRLPGNSAIERDILRRLESGSGFCVLYADLNHFKAFNDRYGFLRGDRLIQRTAELLVSLARGPGDFVGHIGGDDFIVDTTPQAARDLCERIISTFDAMAPGFYDQGDRERGSIEVADRQGHLARFPIVGVAIGVVSNAHRKLTSLGQISQIGAEMKEVAKKAGKSAYAFDRRKD